MAKYKDKSKKNHVINNTKTSGISDVSPNWPTGFLKILYHNQYKTSILIYLINILL